MRLRQHIEVAGQTSELLFESNKSLDRKDALDRLASNRAVVAEYQNKSVTLIPRSTTDLLLWLIALDGTAQSILILSDSTPIEQIDSFKKKSGCRTTVHKPFPPVSDSLDSPSDSKGTGKHIHNDIYVDTTWIIPTSGTTGTPKLVSHNLESLTRSVKMDKVFGSQLRWGLLYDPTRFAGLQTLLQSICGGSALIQPENLSDPDTIVKSFIQNQCNALSATPSMWRRLLMTKDFSDMPLEFLSLGGEIADQQLLTMLSRRFPDSRITHIYASTEAGVGFAVKDRKAGFPASYLATPPPNVRIGVSSEGQLLVKSEKGKAHYIAEPDDNMANDGWIDTGDLVELVGDRYYFLGRRNGAINVGGRKVQPTEVEQCILETEKVVMTRVYGKKNPILGELVVADIVASPGEEESELKSIIQSRCNELLADYKRPAFLKFVKSIEITPTGKIARI